MTTDAFSHPWLGGLFGDDEIAAALGPSAIIGHMLALEAAHARALGHAGIIAPDVASEAAAAIESTSPDMQSLRDGTAVDGVVAPALVRSLKAEIAAPLHAGIHSGLTSQDVIDTSLVLCLKTTSDILKTRLHRLIAQLDQLTEVHGSATLMGRTRMQAALEISVGDRLSTWQRPLRTHLLRLEELLPRLLRLQLGGAVGNRAAWGDQQEVVAEFIARELGLAAAPANWHSERDAIAEFANWLSLVTGSLGKIGQDIALMAQQGIDEVRISGAGGSSAMSHKQNPVKAELLVTLARYNAVQLGGMHQAIVHEQERSGAAWALEWMILPQMVMATGCSLRQGEDLFGAITAMGRRET